MKTYLLKPMVVVCLCLLTASFTFAADNYKMVKVKAPFPMQPIKVFIYPDKDFLITDYGAKNGGEVNNTKAIAAAIEACHKSGGGRVVVPAGIWLTGPIHFKSNVNLYLEENAILNFTDNPSDYLPAVMTSWVWNVIIILHYSMLLNVRMWQLQVKGLFSRRWILGKYGSNVLNLIWRH